MPHAALSLLFTLLLLAGCTAPPAPPPSDTAPTTTTMVQKNYGIPWTTGNYWVQRAYYQDQPDQTLRTIDYYIETVETVNGHEVFRVISAEGARTLWIRTSDGALIKETSNGTEQGFEPPCDAYLGSEDVNQTLEHDCLRVGTRGPGEVLPQQSLTTRVLAKEDINVSGEQFEVLRLETTADGNPLHTEYFAPRACFPARVTRDEGARVLVLDLLTYSCGITV